MCLFPSVTIIIIMIYGISRKHFHSIIKYDCLHLPPKRHRENITMLILQLRKLGLREVRKFDLTLTNKLRILDRNLVFGLQQESIQGLSMIGGTWLPTSIPGWGWAELVKI